MDLKQIQSLILKKKYCLASHAKEEGYADQIKLQEIDRKGITFFQV